LVRYYFDFSGISLETWSLVIYTGTFVTVIAVVLLNQAMVEIPTGTSAVFSSLMPVSAVILSFIALNESIHWYHFVGFLFVLAGILLISKQIKQTVPEEINQRLSL
jgi:drug/metabolite transporter (DMT)-like permease